MSYSDIVFTELNAKNGLIGHILLQRPQALNALSMTMCRAIDEHLVEWENNEAIKAVIIQGEGDRAFCAGGDVRWVYEEGRKDPERAFDFFRQEYAMNARLFHFTKPYIALLHGITMGGGLGVSVHGSHRVGAESLVLAMPETGIGFYPDIGASYFLPRCSGKWGWYLALTGDKIAAKDALYLGLIDFVIDQHDFSSVVEQLTQIHFNSDAHSQVSECLKKWQLPLQPSALSADQLEVDHYFSKNQVELILKSALEATTPRAEKIVSLLQNKSPTSLKLSLALLNRNAHHDFDTCMSRELKLTRRFLELPDFYEGVRAAVVDKDRNPRWQPSKLEEVDEKDLLSWLE